MISEVQLRPKMRLECLLGDFSLLYSLLLLSFIDVSNGFNECVGFLDYLEVVLMFHLAFHWEFMSGWCLHDQRLKAIRTELSLPGL